MREENRMAEREENVRMGQKLARLYERYGLAQALGYLLSSRDDGHVDHIQCVMRKKRGLTRVLLGESGKSPERYLNMTPYRNRWFDRDTLHHVVVPDIAEADGWHSPLDSMNDVHSYGRVRLFEEGEDVFFLMFYSETPGAFSERDLAGWIELAQPVALALREDYRKGKLLPPAPTAPAGTELLRQCRGLAEVMRRVRKAALADCTVLITGETGTGKSMVARALHEYSPRRRHFVHVDCGALPEHLVESELFGHERGAFSGAVAQRVGYLESAGEGTLFLDEIGEMPLGAQSRLLRFLDRHEIVRVGASHPIPLNVRVIAATNRDLEALADAGRFREDLLYRLRVYSIDIPPLRERREDIVTLVRYFLLEMGLRMGIEEPLPLSPEEMRRLSAYDWPGNVRELEHAVTAALVDAREPDGMRPLRFQPGSRSAVRRAAERAGTGGGRFSAPAEAWPTLNGVADAYVRDVLKKTEGRVYGRHGAAEILGVHPLTLRKRMKNMGLPMPSEVAGGTTGAPRSPKN